MTKLLLFGRGQVDILTGVFLRIRCRLIVREAVDACRAVVDRGKKSLVIGRLVGLDGQTKRLEDLLDVTLPDGVVSSDFMSAICLDRNGEFLRTRLCL